MDHLAKVEYPANKRCRAVSFSDSNNVNRDIMTYRVSDDNTLKILSSE